MSIQKTLTLSNGLVVDNAYIRIYKAEVVNGDKAIIDYGIYANQDICNSGKGDKIGNFERITIDKMINSKEIETQEYIDDEGQTQTREVEVDVEEEDENYLSFFENPCIENAYNLLKLQSRFEGAIDC